MPVALPTTGRPIGITTRADDLMSPAACLLVRYLRQVAVGLEDGQKAFATTLDTTQHNLV